MAAKPKITFSTNPNPRNRALIDGLIPIDGYDLEYVGDKYSAGEIHYRFVQGEFDVAEMSTATLMRAKEKGKRFLALPNSTVLMLMILPMIWTSLSFFCSSLIL